MYLENGKSIMEYVRRRLESLLEADGHKPMQFPLVATEENFSKEAEHIKGFMEEVFVMTRGKGLEGERPLIVRPTSETIIYPMFSLWIKSHADLPLKIHQSCEVYRYETKATRPLYRVREVPWNEAHTAHKDSEEAEEQLRRAIEIYKTVLDELSISYLILKRPDFDKFAGAVYSIAFDAWNPDGRMNQVATVHNLGENFARVFEIVYEKADGGKSYAWQLCYGMGYSRVLAAVIAQHGDDVGPVFPPDVAPVQVVIVPIPYKGKETRVLEYAASVYQRLKESFRTLFDNREDTTPGEKYYYWERRGVPIRVEVGPRDMERGEVTLVRRDTRERVSVRVEDVVSKVLEFFALIKENLKGNAAETLREMIVDASDVRGAAEVINSRRICRIAWCGRLECADRLKVEAGGEIRGSRFDVREEPDRPCIVCGEKASLIVYLARAY